MRPTSTIQRCRASANGGKATDWLWSTSIGRSRLWWWWSCLSNRWRWNYWRDNRRRSVCQTGLIRWQWCTGVRGVDRCCAHAALKTIKCRARCAERSNVTIATERSKVTFQFSDGGADVFFRAVDVPFCRHWLVQGPWWRWGMMVQASCGWQSEVVAQRESGHSRTRELENASKGRVCGSGLISPVWQKGGQNMVFWLPMCGYYDELARNSGIRCYLFVSSCYHTYLLPLAGIRRTFKILNCASSLILQSCIARECIEPYIFSLVKILPYSVSVQIKPLVVFKNTVNFIAITKSHKIESFRFCRKRRCLGKTIGNYIDVLDGISDRLL